MSDASLRILGERSRLKGRSFVPTSPARSWTELVTTLHGGLGVLDNECRLIFVSDRFLPALGSPEDLVGRAIHDVMPALAESDPRQLKRQLYNGERVEFEQQFTSSDDDGRWYSVTVLPVSVGDDVAAVAFCYDITATRHRLNQLRYATSALTVVENERRRRVSRDVHDGLIQLLAALIFRLGMSQAEEATRLQRAVSDTARELRRVIEEFSPQAEELNGNLIEQWTTPLLAGTGLTVKVHDRRVAAPGYAETQAAFVLVYQALRAVRDASIERTLNVYLSDEDGGERIVVTIPSRPPAILAGRRAIRLRTVMHHARSLGGTLSQALDDDNVRTFSMWIPRLTNRVETPTYISTPTHRPLDGLHNNVNTLPALSDSAWHQIVAGSPERLIEFDANMTMALVNAATSDSVDLTPDELMGLPWSTTMKFGHIPDVDDIMDRLEAGELVQAQWYRTDMPGDPRLVHLSLSPRLTSDGEWAGMFAAGDDRTDVRLLDDLYQSVLSDLTLTRHRAIERSIRRLEQPLDACQRLIQRIDRFERSCAEPDAINAIKLALVDVLQAIKDSNSSFMTSPRVILDLGAAVRESLGTLLDDRQLLIVDQTSTAPSEDIIEVLFWISREAVTNAVLHGGADLISIVLSSTGDAVECVIHDNGAGLEDEPADHAPGHMGMRVMQARAREHGGSCRIERHSVIGTIVSLTLPNRPRQRSLTDRLDLNA